MTGTAKGGRSISHTVTIPNDRSVVNESYDMAMRLQAESV